MNLMQNSHPSDFSSTSTYYEKQAQYFTAASGTIIWADSHRNGSQNSGEKMSKRVMMNLSNHGFFFPPFACGRTPSLISEKIYLCDFCGIFSEITDIPSMFPWPLKLHLHTQKKMFMDTWEEKRTWRFSSFEMLFYAVCLLPSNLSVTGRTSWSTHSLGRQHRFILQAHRCTECTISWVKPRKGQREG